MSDKLRPCPFCRGDVWPVEHIDTSIGKHFWRVECLHRDCEAEGISCASYNSAEDAARIWNNRLVEDALRAENEALSAELETLRKFRARVGDYSPWRFDDEMSEWFCEQCGAVGDVGGEDEVDALHAGAMAHLHNTTCAWYEPQPEPAE